MFTDGDTNPAAIFAVNNNTDTGAFILIIMVADPARQTLDAGASVVDKGGSADAFEPHFGVKNVVVTFLPKK